MFKINIEIAPTAENFKFETRGSVEFKKSMRRLSNALLALAGSKPVNAEIFKAVEPAESVLVVDYGPGIPKLVQEEAEKVESEMPKPTSAEVFGGYASGVATSIGSLVTCIGSGGSGVASEPYEESINFPPTSPMDNLDSEGLPWDIRIHARTKTKTANGRWKVARNTNPKVVQEVKKGLHGVMSIPPLPIIPSHLTPPPPPMLAPVTETFNSLMLKLTAANSQGKITNAQILSVANQFGFPTIPSIATRPDLIPTISAELDKIIGSV